MTYAAPTYTKVGAVRFGTGASLRRRNEKRALTHKPSNVGQVLHFLPSLDICPSLCAEYSMQIRLDSNESLAKGVSDAVSWVGENPPGWETRGQLTQLCDGKMQIAQRDPV